jgi:predicted ATP-dependent serine protease
MKSNLITIKGSSASGKTTQALRIASTFSGKTMVISSEEWPRDLMVRLIKLGVPRERLETHYLFPNDHSERDFVVGDFTGVQNVMLDVNTREDGRWMRLAKAIENMGLNVIITIHKPVHHPRTLPNYFK